MNQGAENKYSPIGKPSKNTLEITIDFRKRASITFRLKRSPEGHLKSQIPLWSVQAFRTYT